MTDIIAEIVNELQRIKNPILKEEKELLEKRQVLKPLTAEEKEREEQKKFLIKTGTLIDEIIGGGLRSGDDMMIYGEYATGKSQACMTMSVLAPNKVIYIDAEDTLRMSRIKEICEARGLDYDEIKKKFIIFAPKNWVEMIRLIYSLPSPADLDEKVSLIVLDSLNKHFRGIEFAGREKLVIKGNIMLEFLNTLKRICQMHNAGLVFTAQIYEVPVATPYTSITQIQKPMGGHKIGHEPTIRLFFRKSTGNVRIATVMDNSFKPLAERPFVINEKGIDILPEEAKVYKRLERKVKDFEKKQKQEEIKSRKKSESDEE